MKVERQLCARRTEHCRSAAISLGLTMFGLGAAADTHAAVGEVRVLRVEGVINPISARYVVRGIEDAAEEGDAAVLIEVDTPGGLLDATQGSVPSSAAGRCGP